MLDDEATINMGIHHELREVPGKVPKQADMDCFVSAILFKIGGMDGE